MRRVLTVLAVAAALAAVPARAWATPFAFYLNNPNSAISGFNGPYATVTINLTDSTHADVTFQSLAINGEDYLMGDGQSVALNTNGTASVVGGAGGVTFSNPYSGFMPASVADLTPNQNADGFGKFNFIIDSFDGFDHASTSISFTLLNTSGTWSSSTDVLTLNSNNQLAASHIFVCGSVPCVQSAGALATGYAAGNGLSVVPLGNPPPIPEPTSLALFGSGLVLAAAQVRRRLKP